MARRFPKPRNDANGRRVGGSSSSTARNCSGGASQRYRRPARSRIRSRGEHDRHRTFFGEASVTGIAGAQTWVGGVAWQGDTYSSRDVPAFDYRYSVPALFGQDDITLNRHVTVSASARLDAHNQYGTFVSPRLSTLIKPGGPWTVRVSAGRGYFAPRRSRKTPKPLACARCGRWVICRPNGRTASRAT